MEIDLNDKVVRILVQEYTNAIVNYKTKEELDFDVHKLIHTFYVVDVANELIKLTPIKLSKKIKKQILNAALLHDIGRCYEFKEGVLLKGFDHGHAGSLLVQKYFPSLEIESVCTEWHNKRPSEKDPAWTQPVLDYTRDADMLGNIWYNTMNVSIFIQHILGCWDISACSLKLNKEIRQAVIERRSCVYSQMEKFDFWDMLVAQLLWIYNLRTTAAFRFAKRHQIFKKNRDVIVEQILPLLRGTSALKKKAADEINVLFPDALFDEELKRHGL